METKGQEGRNGRKKGSDVSQMHLEPQVFFSFLNSFLLTNEYLKINHSFEWKWQDSNGEKKDSRHVSSPHKLSFYIYYILTFIKNM